MSVGPGVVGAFKRLAAPEGERRFEGSGFVVGVGAGEQLVELVEVDANLAAVQTVALAFVNEGFGERGACVGRQVPEAPSGLCGVGP